MPAGPGGVATDIFGFKSTFGSISSPASARGVVHIAMLAAAGHAAELDEPAGFTL
jgi:hypothetical protein